MKIIKEKSSIVNPRLTDATSRIPQTVQRVAREISTNNDPDRSKSDTPENEASDCVQDGTLQATSYVVSGLRGNRDKINDLTHHSRKNSFNKNQATNRTSRHRFSYVKKKIKPTPVPQNVVNLHSPNPTSNFIKGNATHAPKIGKEISKTIVQGIQTAGRSIIATAKAALASIRGIGSLLAVGGWIAVAIIVVLAIVCWIITSPTSILAGGFSEDDSGRTVYSVLEDLTQEVDARIEEIIDNAGDDCNVSIEYVDGNDDILSQIGPQTLAIYSVLVSMDPENPREVVTLDSHKETVLRNIFWDTVLISYGHDESTYIDENGVEQLDRNIEITVDCMSLDEVVSHFGFTDEQLTVIHEMMDSGYFRQNKLYS
jgi:hypothetical protein